MAWHRPDVKCGYGYSREGLELRIKYGILDIEEIEVPEGMDFGRYRRLKGVVRWPKGAEEARRHVMTDYQRKYYAMLYRTGQMNRRKANRIPMEWRAEARQIGVRRRMVEYLMRGGFKTEKQVRERVERLNITLMSTEKSGDKKASEAIKQELGTCDEILKKTFPRIHERTKKVIEI